jgi:hypothetical protein
MYLSRSYLGRESRIGLLIDDNINGFLLCALFHLLGTRKSLRNALWPRDYMMANSHRRSGDSCTKGGPWIFQFLCQHDYFCVSNLVSLSGSEVHTNLTNSDNAPGVIALLTLLPSVW